MTPNPCHSKPRPTASTSYIAQAGWAETFRDGFGQPCRVPIYVDVQHRLSCECKYSIETNDPRCGAFPDLGIPVCPHRHEKP